MDPGAAHRPHADRSRLRELQAGTTIVAALAFYDRLEPVGVEEMIGSWRGEGLPTGNPLDGLLERFGWYGKRFDGPDGAHPLVFDAGAGPTMLLNPAFVPIAALIRYRWLLRAPFVPRLFSVASPAALHARSEGSTSAHGLSWGAHRHVVLRRPSHQRRVPQGRRRHARRRHGPARPGGAVHVRPTSRSPMSAQLKLSSGARA